MPIIIIQKKNVESLEERVFKAVKDNYNTPIAISQLLNRSVSSVNICLSNLKKNKRIKYDKYTNKYTLRIN